VARNHRRRSRRYYPFSSRFSGNLTHDVGSGDFVEAMLRESMNATEYAFGQYCDFQHRNRTRTGSYRAETLDRPP
jgi:hypothetical protein